MKLLYLSLKIFQNKIVFVVYLAFLSAMKTRSFVTLITGVFAQNFIFVFIMLRQNRLECLSLQSF